MKLDLKDILLYGLCVPSGLYALYEGTNLFGYISQLKSESADCYRPNPNRFELLFGTILALSVLSFPIQAAARGFYDRQLPETKFPAGSKARRVKVEIMAERTFRLFIYIAVTLLGLWIMKQSTFLHKYLLGDTYDPQYFSNYPCQALPRYLDDFYIIKFAYHLFECLSAGIFHRDRKDFSEFLLHHILTIVLVGYSYVTNVIPIGGSVMLIMDASDIFTALFKLTVDVSDAFLMPSYVLMLTSWVYFRMWFFPIYLMKEIWV